MKRTSVIIAVTAALAACSSMSSTSPSSAASTPAPSASMAAVATTSGPPAWAFGFADPMPTTGIMGGTAGGAGGRGAGAPAGGGAGGRGAGNAGRGNAPPPDTTRRTVAGSSLSFTLNQIRDTFGPADWFPSDHGTMPEIVAHGKRDAQVLACALCHYPNGKGRAENAGVSGLPAEYFVHTMMDFKNDLRHSSDTRKANTGRMIAFAKAMTDDEIRATAAYFGAVKWSAPWVKVVEADMVPKTRIAAGLFIAAEGAQAGMEPIGHRIIEVPENAEQTETLRNPRSGFIAYAPKGSIARGETIAMRAQCALCHGADLRGLGPVPPIAGRSPSYVARQLYDMQAGARKGTWTDLMKSAVAPLSQDDIIAVAAYVASKAP